MTTRTVRRYALAVALAVGLWPSLAIADARNETQTFSGIAASSQGGAINVGRGRTLTAIVCVTKADGSSPTLDIQVEATGNKSAARWGDYGTAIPQIIVISPSGGCTVARFPDLATKWVRADLTIGGGSPTFDFTIDWIIQN